MPLGHRPIGSGALAQGPLTVLVTVPVVEVRRGGATYLTDEELRELARQQRLIEEREAREREVRKEFDRSVAESYRDITDPKWRVKALAAQRERDEEEELLVIMLCCEDA